MIPDQRYRNYMLLVLSLVLLSSCASDDISTNHPAPQTIHIAVARHFSPAMEELVRTWQSESGHVALMHVGSDSDLSKHIQNEHTFDIFFANDVAIPFMLEQAGHGTHRSTYAVGQLALWFSQADTAAQYTTVRDISQLGSQPVVLADPQSTPSASLPNRFYNTLILGIVSSNASIPTKRSVSAGARPLQKKLTSDLFLLPKFIAISINTQLRHSIIS